MSRYKYKYYIVGIFIVILAIAGIFFGNYYITFKKENVKQDTTILIYKNYDYNRFIDTLRASGAIDNWKSFMRAAKKREFANHFEPGRYVIKKGMSNQIIIRTISNNIQTPLKFTLRGYVKTIDKLSALFARSFEADSSQFAQALNDPELRDSLGFKKESYIGMFIPNSYEFYWTSSPKAIIKRFKKEYDRFWNSDREAKAAKINFTKEEVITLASIITEETNNVSEMPKIAGVYINRIHKRMPLQACPTVIYAHLNKEPDIKRLLLRHLTIESPYNTYKKLGLPPGPITIPPISAIDAVLNYEHSNYLYFCAKPEFDGTHNFASTYSEHKKNSIAYNKAFAALESKKNQ